MTDVEYFEERIKTVENVIGSLEKTIRHYRNEEGRLVMKLNRARRLEREAKELQS